MKTVIFCDFDGTITVEETFIGALSQLISDEEMSYWGKKLASGEMNIKQCTQALFSTVPSSKRGLVEEYAKTVHVRPGFREFLEMAKEKGMEVIVLSAGIKWMQEIILAPYMDLITDFISGTLDTSGEYMDFSSEYSDDTEVLNKSFVMAEIEYDKAICIGDGVVDLTMAAVSDTIFARADLAKHLDEQGKAYIPYEDFYDIKKSIEIVDS